MKFGPAFYITVSLACNIAGVDAGSKLFSGATIIAWDEFEPEPRVLRDGYLLVEDDRIANITTSKPSRLPRNIEVIDASNQIISPGFIDTHRHGWQTAFKTLGSNTTLAQYFGRYGEFAAAPHFTPEDVYWGQLAGLLEALNAGVTTSLDHAHHTWSNEIAYAGLNASIESGARVFWAYAFHDVPVLNYTVKDQIPNFIDMAESGILQGTNVELGIAYDSFGPNPPDVAKEVANLARDYNVSVVTTHSLAGPFGVSNLPEDIHSFDLLNTSIPVVFSHGSFLTATSANLLRQTNQYLSITPESEMHYGHTHPHSYYIQDQAALGVDTHFTYSTDILTQARIWLQSVRYFFFDRVLSGWEVPKNNPMSVVQAFSLATRAGGLALRRPELGTIREGAKADLIAWNAAESPSLLGWTDPIAAIMLHASVGDILHVMVNGDFVKRDGKLAIANYETIRRRFLESARRIKNIYQDLDYPSLGGEFNGGGNDYGEARVADTERGKSNGCYCNLGNYKDECLGAVVGDAEDGRLGRKWHHSHYKRVIVGSDDRLLGISNQIINLRSAAFFFTSARAQLLHCYEMSEKSPKSASPRSPESQGPVATAAQALEVDDVPEGEEDDPGLGEDSESSTASITSSILHYRTINGRTYHSERGNAAYWGSNDERQSEAMDIAHHMFTLSQDGELHLAPLNDSIQYPGCEVIGTDISPIQPSWVPPNVKFEIEDFNQDWTFPAESFDYVHLRYLVGCVPNWDNLFEQAFKVLKPGGWVESFEASAIIESDDDSVKPDSALAQWGPIFIKASKTIGNTFTVVGDNLQRPGIEKAGFTDVKQWDSKLPLNPFPKDPKLKQIGQFGEMFSTQDTEGLVLFVANTLGWTPEEVHVYIAKFRQEIRDRRNHPYIRLKTVWARKPE
ncbi:amidohydrolase family [Fusarium sp. NRRL 52700]|nr:amidohydrolase family [Fusarium sp. NRRL 52700]